MYSAKGFDDITASAVSVAFNSSSTATLSSSVSFDGLASLGLLIKNSISCRPFLGFLLLPKNRGNPGRVDCKARRNGKAQRDKKAGEITGRVGLMPTGRVRFLEFYGQNFEICQPAPHGRAREGKQGGAGVIHAAQSPKMSGLKSSREISPSVHRSILIARCIGIGRRWCTHWLTACGLTSTTWASAAWPPARSIARCSAFMGEVKHTLCLRASICLTGKASLYDQAHA